MIEHSESVKAIAAALAKAQGEIENAHKNAKNPHFRNTYADLAEVVNTTRPVLSKHGIAVVQMPGYANGEATLDTMLLHESGEWIRSTSAAPVSKKDPQGIGSALTYLRRYSLAAACGIAQEDDDGEAASGRERKESKPTKAEPKDERKATDAQYDRINALLDERDMDAAKREQIVQRVAGGLTADEAKTAIEWLETMPAKKGRAA